MLPYNKPYYLLIIYQVTPHMKTLHFYKTDPAS